jgi:hypothetical protein
VASMTRESGFNVGNGKGDQLYACEYASYALLEMAVSPCWMTVLFHGRLLRG